MKKVALTIFMAVAATVAGYAQTAYDAFLFSDNNYEGTARTMAMGNAFTALGGDLGSISINPAGSAVAKHSQFIISPSLTFTTCTAQGVSPYSDGSLPYFENKYKKYAMKVYHCYRAHTQFGEVLYMFYCSNQAGENREFDENIKDNIIYCYAENMTDPSCSEFGTCYIRSKFGGVEIY